MKRFFLLFFFVSLFSGIPAQNIYPGEASTVEFLGKSRPLRNLPLLAPGNSKEKHRQFFPKEVPNFTLTSPMPRPFSDVALPRAGDPLLSRQAAGQLSTIVEPDTVWEGLGQDLIGIQPPDPVVDASPDHILQMTNVAAGAYLRVFDKAGTILLDMPNLNSLWSEFNANSSGDPIVLWDQAAGRWMISEISSLFSSEQSLLIAISETSDPLGSWMAYRLQIAEFPDYAKYSVWHNAYIVTTNERGEEIPIYVLEREAMLAGLAEVRVQRLGVPKVGEANSFQVLTPIDFDGFNPPPPGSPAYVVRPYDDAWAGGQDKVELWEIHIDWFNPENSFLSGPVDIVGAPFDLELCEQSLFSCLPQPNGIRLDALQDIILHRVSYLNSGTHESILLHFAVDADGNNRAGLRWMELRQDNGTWYLHQEGTYAPNDGLHRFAGGIAMDYSGNIFMAYTTTGPTVHPSLRFTGRYADDPLGEMTIEEYEFGTGRSSQSSNRWGDYAAMSIDPSNGQDFWFTGEYMKAGGNWGTKILKAKLRKDSTDAGPQALIRPEDSAFLTDAETVQVAVRNYGSKAASDISISYSVDGGALTTDIITATIPPEESYRHTFSTTANLEAVGAHHFFIFTSLEGDSARFNDTLRTTVFQLPRKDAAIADIKGLENIVCDTFRQVSIALANQGADTLISAVVTYQLDEGPPEQVDWAGSLAPGEQEPISVSIGPLSGGDHVFSAVASLPNGLSDENPDNNNQEKAFMAFPGAEEILLQLTTDGYPQETTWELRDGAGNLLYSGGPYSEGESLFEEGYCLPEACFTFTLFDTYGDGLSGITPGSFQIVDEAGSILALLSEVNFGSEITLEFCVPFECRLTLSGMVMVESGPGVADGQVFLSPNNGIPPFEYSIDGGAAFQFSSTFNGLVGGNYPVVVRDANQCVADTVLQIPTCNLMASAEVTPVSEPSQADGRITVEVSGGIGPYLFSLNEQDFQAENIFEGLEFGEYEITIRDEGTNCETSLSVIIDPPVGVARSRFFGRQVKLYPNPTEGYIRIEIRGAADVAFLPLRILNESGQVMRYGRLVTYGELTKGVVSLYGLPAGVYYLYFQHEKFPGGHMVLKK